MAKKCPDCGGLGEQLTNTIISADTLTVELKDETVKIICPTCKGTGKAIKKES